MRYVGALALFVLGLAIIAGAVIWTAIGCAYAADSYGGGCDAWDVIGSAAPPCVLGLSACGFAVVIVVRGIRSAMRRSHIAVENGP